LSLPATGLHSFTKVDWLRFRALEPPERVFEAFRDSLGAVGSVLKRTPKAGGWMGYEACDALYLGQMVVGQMAYGGHSQKGWVSLDLTGRGCEWVSDWSAAQDALGGLKSYQNRRVDIALDTFKREVTHETVCEAYHGGLFKTGGRPPKMSQILPSQKEDGRTIYIGDRRMGKFLRAYEKGYQLVKGFSDSVTHLDGVPVADIYRLELELKAKDGDLPDDLIDQRDRYFAGSYPYLQSVLDVEPEIFIQRREKGPQTDLNKALSHLRSQYGSTLYTALVAHHGDISRVWQQICGSTHNQALVDLGVLDVEHE
jgi:phage replication initiation protein